MSTTKVAITIDEAILSELDRLVEKRIFPNRSKAIQEAIKDKLARMRRGRLARECAKLDRKFEQTLSGPILTLYAVVSRQG
jgi:metal-responsive CopG/Arc/MetJ family transcriptional regulator